MHEIADDDEIEKLALRGEQKNGHDKSLGDDGLDDDGLPSGDSPTGDLSDEETVYEFTLTPQSTKEALGNGLKAVKAGTKGVMATRRAIERRREINRRARRAKMKDGLQIVSLLANIFT